MARPLGLEFGVIYKVTGPDGTEAVFNDSTNPSYSGLLAGDQAVSGLQRGEVREVADVLPEADGGIHGPFRRGRLPFSLNGIVAVDDFANPDAQDRILLSTNALKQNGLLEWWPSTVDEGVFIEFREQQPTSITSRRPKTFLIAGVSEDPYVYSRDLQQAVVAPATLGGGGFSSPLASPLTSTAPAAGVVTVAQGGSSLETWPTYYICGPCVNPSITNLATGVGMSFVFTLTNTQALKISTQPRLRRIDLGSSLFDISGNLIGADGLTRRNSALNWFVSEWPYLRRETNNIQIAFDSFSAGAQLMVEWRDTWG